MQPQDGEQTNAARNTLPLALSPFLQHPDQDNTQETGSWSFLPDVRYYVYIIINNIKNPDTWIDSDLLVKLCT